MVEATMTLGPVAQRTDLRLDKWRLKNRVEQQLFGLCAFETFLRTNHPLAGATLEVRFGPASLSLPMDQTAVRADGDAWHVIFHVNTHLLSNGSHSLSVRVVWADGAVGEWPAAEHEIDNASPLAMSVANDVAHYGTPIIFGRIVDSTLFPYNAGRARSWFDTPATHQIPLSFEPARDDESARNHLREWGFCILSATVPQDMIDRFNKEIDKALGDGRLQYKWGSSERIHGAHKLPHGTDIWLFRPVLHFLRNWFRDEPCACQSLLYLHGSEQSAHQDTIHLTPYPAGYMCGVWVALEDVKSDSGELFVYPGSHRSERQTADGLHLPKVSTDYSAYAVFDCKIAELMLEAGFERRTYRPKAGQILVWHENLVHGGSKRLDHSITRRSIVSHYFARGSIAYYDSRGEAANLEAVL